MICRFPSTNWPLVVSTRDPAPPKAAAPMAELCDLYWYPVYAYLRQRGHRADEAEDLTQGFFVHLLKKRILERAEPHRGRLRSLILACLKNFVANEQSQRRALKRGGLYPAAVRPPVHPRDVIEPSVDLTPETIYERQWAVVLLRRVLDQLRDELARAGKQHVFDALKGCLVGDHDDAGYRDAAAALNTTEGHARVTVHRLRRRYRQLLLSHISATVHGAATDVDEEIRYLFSVMQRQPRREVLS
jgi:DNA-directed RNA polymerase specialized sigma24 family protein